MSADGERVKVRYYYHILVETQNVHVDMDSEIDSFCHYIVLCELMDIDESVYALVVAVAVENVKVF